MGCSIDARVLRRHVIAGQSFRQCIIYIELPHNHAYPLRTQARNLRVRNAFATERNAVRRGDELPTPVTGDLIPV